MNKKQHNEQSIAKIIERENVISYKRKNPQKAHPKSHNENQDGDSAYSLKSGVFSENGANGTLTRLTKNTPLPELSKQRKRFNIKSLTTESKLPQSYFDKQVRQQDNLLLKQKNNYLVSQNMRLKTRIMGLQKENNHIQKILEDDKRKCSVGAYKQIKFKGSQSVSMKVVIKNLRKELEDVKAQNNKIKWSIKFTTINQLQILRDCVMDENARLREILEEEQNRRLYLKANQQGYSQIQNKIIALQDRNQHLSRENAELKQKITSIAEHVKSNGKSAENQKNLGKMLYNARRVIKEKQKEIQNLKVQLRNQNSKPIVQTHNKNTQKKDPLQKYRQRVNPKRQSDKRAISKSAQKYQINVNDKQLCNNCKKLQQKINSLQKQLQALNYTLKDYEQVRKTDYIQLSKDPIIPPGQNELKQIQKYLTFRFKAHHLSLDQSKKYLINAETNPDEMDKSITVSQLVQNLIAQPFSFVNNRYIQICVVQLMYPLNKSDQVTIDGQKAIKKSQVIDSYSRMVTKFDLSPQHRQEQMFIQIAELVTNYHQQILTALSNKKNGEGTISQQDLVVFFKQIQLEQQYIDFIITQIILESIDLQRLNYYALFQIFYMPTQQLQDGVVDNIKGNKYNVVENVVKQQDEQYEQSRSHVEARQKTFSKNSEGISNLSPKPDNNSQIHPQQQQLNHIQLDQYAENFEQQKIQQIPQQVNKQANKKQVQRHYALDEDIAIYDDYEAQFDT